MPAATRLCTTPTRRTSPSVKRLAPVRLEDPEVDQSAKPVSADAGSLGRFGEFVPLHEPYCSEEPAG